MFFYNKIKRKLRRNLKFFFVLILLTCVYYTYFTIENVTLTTADISHNVNDFTVNTSDYLARFNEYRAIKYKQKLNADSIQYKHIKTVVEDARHDVNKPIYTIYEYTKFFGQIKNCHSENQTEKVFSKECPYKNCKFSCDLNDLARADAVLFHESDMKYYMKSDVNYIDRIAKMHRKNSNQIYILWNDEANEVLESFDTIKFNWSLSYRYDAEVSGIFSFILMESHGLLPTLFK